MVRVRACGPGTPRASPFTGHPRWFAVRGAAAPAAGIRCGPHQLGAGVRQSLTGEWGGVAALLDGDGEHLSQQHTHTRPPPPPPPPTQFSNHTGFPVWRGTVMDGDQLWELIEGMEANGLLQHTHLLTGERPQGWPGAGVPRTDHPVPPLPTHPSLTLRCAGYIGSTSLLETIVRVAERLRQHNPGLVYGERSTCTVTRGSRPPHAPPPTPLHPPRSPTPRSVRPRHG